MGESSELTLECSPKTFKRIQEEPTYLSKLMEEVQQVQNETSLSSEMFLSSVIEGENEKIPDLERNVWVDAAIKLLISSVAELQPKIGKTLKLKKKGNMWNEIKIRLSEKGYSFSAQQIENKYRGLERQFKKANSHNKKTGRDRKPCPYEKELTELLQGRPSVFPECLIGSRREDLITSIQEKQAGPSANLDFASLSSGNELNAADIADYVDGTGAGATIVSAGADTNDASGAASSKKINSFLDKNLTSNVAPLGKRWHPNRSHSTEIINNSTPAKGQIPNKSAKKSSNRLKRRRDRRRKFRKRLQNSNNTTISSTRSISSSSSSHSAVIPVTNLTATATVIDHSSGGTSHNEITTVALSGRNTSYHHQSRRQDIISIDNNKDTQNDIDNNSPGLTKLSPFETANYPQIVEYKSMELSSGSDSSDANKADNDNNIVVGLPKRTMIRPEIQMSRKTKGPRRGNKRRKGNKAATALASASSSGTVRFRDNPDNKIHSKLSKEERQRRRQRKNSKDNREKRKRLRQERIEQRKRKNQTLSENAAANVNTVVNPPNSGPDNMTSKWNPMIPPSIDYIVERVPSSSVALPSSSFSSSLSKTNELSVINDTISDGSVDVAAVNVVSDDDAESESSRHTFNEERHRIVDRNRDPTISVEDFSANQIDGIGGGGGGDLSCLRDNFQPAPEVRNADVKYLRNDLRGADNAFLEVEYICHYGYILDMNDNYKIATTTRTRTRTTTITTNTMRTSSKNLTTVYCKNGQWVGVLPTCVPVKDLTNFNETCNYPGRCEQICYRTMDNGHGNGNDDDDGDGDGHGAVVERCTCHKGFRMRNSRCEDINECMENTAVCEYGCINTIGSYRCKCPKGLHVSDTNSCIDVNECLLRNGHGPCQDTCINTWGSYKCSCENIPGSQLNTDGHSCLDVDECSVNNGGCSHTCLNTMGRAFCLCPEGWVLDGDWKTCVDIDECADQRSSEMKCEFGCINTPGSYSCLVDIGADQPIEDDEPECPDGYYRNFTTEDCQDRNECAENNGGCHHICVNTIGSYHCVCRPGFILDGDKNTCVETTSSTDISCPPLFPPKHGYLECSRPIATDIIGVDVNGLGGRRRITNRPGSQCVLRCPTGFRLNGKFSKQCSTSGAWVGENDGTCIRYPTPKLICPADIVLETPPNESMAKLRIPRPKTDVNYDRDVTVHPEWLRNSEVALEIGLRNITYTARHPVSKLFVSCTFSITVLEGEPPAVKFCPPTQKYSLSESNESIKIAWKEPVFMDNVNVTEVSRTNIPGNSFAVGNHQIVYVARDQAGYTARCVFKLIVNVPYRQTLNHPLPIYHMFYRK